MEPHGSVQQARRFLRRQLLLRGGRGAVRVRPAARVSAHLRPAGVDHSKPGAGLQHHAHCGLRSQCGRYVRDRSDPDPLSFRGPAGRRGVRLWAPAAGLCESLPVPGRVVPAAGAAVRYPPVARRRVAGLRAGDVDGLGAVRHGRASGRDRRHGLRGVRRAAGHSPGRDHARRAVGPSHACRRDRRQRSLRSRRARVPELCRRLAGGPRYHGDSGLVGTAERLPVAEWTPAVVRRADGMVSSAERRATGIPRIRAAARSRRWRGGRAAGLEPQAP